jgi:hypothetical protein
MHRTLGFIVLVLAPVAAVLVDQASAQQPPRPAGFFITSNATGTGDVGGLAGADKICQQLSQALPGGANRTWRAYMSTTGAGAVSARDRIGNGPWYNVKGVADREQRRGTALRQGEHQQRHGARRDGAHDQRPGRAQPS